ncbi:MAG: ATP-binding cassette domain-containing protein [Rhodospirillales bacterium]|nr:ATP-binding cassette domain-containing protein [Rhodospirillales bacterium]MDE0379012.1 ATP-binding cassette domain-containing protein [Rhodospirillales bacterium]
MSITVTARGVVKAFDGRPVLRGVDLDVPEGQSTVLVGPSSGGKSVLLKCLLGLMPMEGGSVRFGDTDLASLDKSGLEQLMRGIGVLFQQNALFDSLSVWENVAFTLIHGHGMARRTARQRAADVLVSVGLGPEVADLSPAELSGGMQKRVALGRAIAAEPRFLVLDDPTAGLDPILTGAIVALIRGAIERTGTTALTVTSDMDIARRSFDRLAMLHEGAILWQGATADIDESGNAYLDQLVNQRAEGPIHVHTTA